MADVYTSGSGNWTSPGNGVVNIKLRGTGGGGAAGEAGGVNRAGSGGGGGAYCEVIALPVTKYQSIAYSIGTPGVGGTYDNDDATAGTATTADGGAYSAGGGGKGGFGGGAAGGAGGTASGGDINTSGSAGSVNPTSTTGGAGGAGANSGGSGGIGGIAGTQLAGDGADPGGGGGGGGDNSSFGGGDTADGGSGGGGSATFNFTAGALVSSEILRPIAGLEEYAANTTWQDIDDVVTQPTIPGDAVYLGYDSAVAATFVEKWKVQAPTSGYTILGATLWMLIWLPTTALPGRYVYSVRIRLNGTWYDLGAVNRSLGVGPAWYSFELTGISESSDSDDIGFEVTLTFTGGSSQSIQIDAAYLELTYPSLEQSSGFLLWF